MVSVAEHEGRHACQCWAGVEWSGVVQVQGRQSSLSGHYYTESLITSYDHNITEGRQTGLLLLPPDCVSVIARL